MAKPAKAKASKRVQIPIGVTGFARRAALINNLEQLRGTRVISYVTSTRPGSEVQMALDSIRYIYDRLEEIRVSAAGEALPPIDLFIHSNGGDGTVPWRLVTLIREYTNKFSVIVPNRAFSAATLTALGGDQVVMHPMGMLGPTDPTVSNPFNPTDARGKQIGISVEDVTAYIQLIKEDAGIQHEDELIQGFNILANHVHPLALGNVKRSISQSRMMADKLLRLHMDNSQSHKIDKIVENLTSKLYYHGHPICRREAREQIDLATVVDATGELEAAIWELYLEYETIMELSTPFDPALEFFAAQDPDTMPTGVAIPVGPGVRRLAYIESATDSSECFAEHVLSGLKQADGNIVVTAYPRRRGWRKGT